ncbi:helix-turn-helix domain-containing protein [Paenibacillus cremeus]|uniref:AraC family transcriptional regulator n=1 Tax=Paenibacillus cremeus TaxID=2163881 RepID=A0A559JZW9_9BACL|nr:helix-turn-helix domain-containing protein [Paenibacillus cremeus]TVY05428.1 AraC family transcriptional regulator [Paenibacillus cremeus]
MRFLQGNLSGRFKMIYGLFFLLIISSTVWLSYLSSKGSLEHQVRSTNIALLNLIQQKIEMMLREIDTNTINFIQEPEVAFFLHGQYATDELRFNHFRVLNDRFRSLMFANSNVSSFYLYSLEKKSLLTDTTFSEQSDFYDMSWLDSFNRMKSYQQWLDTRKITEISSGFQNDKNVVTLIRSYPLISNPQFRKGAIVVNVAETTISNLIQDVDTQRAGQTLVVNPQGMIISSQNKKQLFQPLSSIEGAPELEQMGSSGYLTKPTLNGGSYTTFYLTSAYNGWKYVSIVPDPEMNRPLQLIRNFLLAIAVGMFILAIVIVFAVSNYTFRPLELFFRSFTEKKIAGAGDLTYMEQFFKQILSDNESLQKQMNESLPALKWRLIMSLLMGDKANYNRMRPYFGTLGITLHAGQFVVLVIELDRIQEIASPRDVYLFTYAVSNVAEELVAGVCKGVSLELTDGRVAVIMSFEEEGGQGHQLQALQVADLLKDYVKGHFKQTVTIGVGRPHKQWEGIQHSYREALTALKYKLIMGDNTVVSIDDVAGNDHNDNFYRLSGMADSVVGLIRDTDKGKLEARLNHIFGEMIGSNVPPEMIKQMCIQLIMKSIKVISDKGLEVKEFLDPRENIYHRIESCANVDEIKSYLSTFLHHLIARTEQNRAARGSNETIQQIMDYLEQHYMDSDLSLNLLASQFRLSVPYLSKLFKETMEQNFMDWLIELRMEKSKALLLNPSSKIQAIAESVGYNNTQSFIRIFKKYTGQTPGEFRENHKKGEEDKK